MWIKNNSTREWLGYKIDGFKLDITAGLVFEIPDAVAFNLLKILGADSWLTETEAPKKKRVVEKEEEPKVTTSRVKKNDK